MDGDQRAAFTAEDVLELRPLVRHAQTAASDAPAFMYSGQSRVEQGEVREGCELVAEALHLYIAVYGATHRDTADCLRVLARLHYSLGETQQALIQQQGAVIMSERVLGFDHPSTIMEYMNVGVVLHGLLELRLSLLFLQSALSCTLATHGEHSLKTALA
ncbi:unnamed protein product [Lampetra fluviatilis]